MPDVTQLVDIASEHPDEANTTAEARDPDTEVLEQTSAVLAAPTASGLRYLPAFTNLPAGEWLIVHKSSTGEKLAWGYATVTLTDGTFKVYGARASELPATANSVNALDTKLGTPANDSLADDIIELTATIGDPADDSLAIDIAAIKGATDTLLERITTQVTTLWTNLIAMISGSGGTAAYTETALANAPAGGGGGGGDATLENQTTILSRLATILTQTGLITAGQLQVISPVSLGGDLTLYIGDDYAGAHAISLPVSDAGEVLKTYLESCTSVIFGAGKDSAANQIIGTIDKTAITHIEGTNTTYLPLTVTSISTRPGEGFIYAIKGIDDDGEHTKVIGCLKLEAERAQVVDS